MSNPYHHPHSFNSIANHIIAPERGFGEQEDGSKSLKKLPESSAARTFVLTNADVPCCFQLWQRMPNHEREIDVHPNLKT
jgi:hypothetical protein